jgi:Skp family chaperone for outer membrane proteins
MTDYKNFEKIISDKLPKLDVLDVINKKFENFEKSIHGMKVEIDQIKAKQNEHRRILAVEEEHHHNIEDQVRKLELGNRELENENIETRENFIKLQSHSMKYNLIFSGILQRDNEKSVYCFLC